MHLDFALGEREYYGEPNEGYLAPYAVYWRLNFFKWREFVWMLYGVEISPFLAMKIIT